MPGSREGAVTCSNMLHIAALSQHTSTEWCKHIDHWQTRRQMKWHAHAQPNRNRNRRISFFFYFATQISKILPKLKFLSAPLTRHPSRHMQSCFPGRLPHPHPPTSLTFPQKPSCPDDLRNANISQKLANGRCGSVHVFRREKGAPSTEVRGTGLVVERLHGGG